MDMKAVYALIGFAVAAAIGIFFILRHLRRREEADKAERRADAESRGTKL